MKSIQVGGLRQGHDKNRCCVSFAAATKAVIDPILGENKCTRLIENLYNIVSVHHHIRLEPKLLR